MRNILTAAVVLLTTTAAHADKVPLTQNIFYSMTYAVCLNGSDEKRSFSIDTRRDPTNMNYTKLALAMVCQRGISDPRLGNVVRDVHGNYNAWNSVVFSDEECDIKSREMVEMLKDTIPNGIDIFWICEKVEIQDTTDHFYVTP